MDASQNKMPQIDPQHSPQPDRTLPPPTLYERLTAERLQDAAITEQAIASLEDRLNDQGNAFFTARNKADRRIERLQVSLMGAWLLLFALTILAVKELLQ